MVGLSGTVPPGDMFMGWEYDDLIGNAILKFPEKHAFVQTLRDGADDSGCQNIRYEAEPFQAGRSCSRPLHRQVRGVGRRGELPGPRSLD